MQGVARFILYLTVATATFLFVSATYILYVDRVLVGRGHVPPQYSKLLLQATADVRNKIVIVGGSSSDNGIDAAMLAHKFHRLVVNAAENGNVPLNFYIHEVAPVLKKGDTLILPVELPYYRPDQKITQNFVQSVFSTYGSMKAMYASQPFLERLRVILTATPIKLAGKEFLRRLRPGNDRLIAVNRTIAVGYMNGQNVLSTVLGTVEPGHSGDPAWGRVLNRIGCDPFIFQVKRPDQVRLGDSFRRTVSWLADHLQKKGVRIFFAWTPVIPPQGGSCYTGKWRAAVQHLDSQIRGVLKPYEMPMVGGWSEYRYPPSCRLDSPFHLTESCREKHTIRLAQDLLRAGLRTATSDNWSGAMVRSRVKHQIDLWTKRSLNELPLLSSRSRSGDVAANIAAIKGWMRPEHWGTWSDGPRSVFVVKVPQAKMGGIHITGGYHGRSEATRVKVNGKNVGDYNLTNARIPLVNVGRDGLARIELTYRDPSLASFRIGEDYKRQIKFSIASVAFVNPVIRKLPERQWTSNLLNHVLLNDGWSSPESWGVWTLGKRSDFQVNVPAGARAIAVRGQYFGPPEHTPVYINGQFVGRFDLHHAVIPLPPTIAGGLLKVEFLNKHPIAPRDVDPHSKDKRKIKFGLTALRVMGKAQ